MKETSRGREYREGWTGRRRNYNCIGCGNKFQHDGRQMPKKARYCYGCRRKPEIQKAMTDAYEKERVKANG